MTITCHNGRIDNNKRKVGQNGADDDQSLRRACVSPADFGTIRDALRVPADIDIIDSMCAHADEIYARSESTWLKSLGIDIGFSNWHSFDVTSDAGKGWTMTRAIPDHIRELADDEVFVFGSNAGGRHGGGAARTAHQRFGAEWGVGEGLTGGTYALPTMEGTAAFEQAAARFVTCAEEHPELTFLLTKVGCGIAGHDEQMVKAWFAVTPPNVVKPAGW